MAPAIPTATYRLQLSAAFGFDRAAALVPYLRALGISHLYASPFLKARAGSTHGYDIVDHNALNPEFGGDEAFARLSAALAQADMGLILDFVPNHMGVGHADNAWWLDVLEWGPRSPYAASFDIDWQTLPYKREGGLLIPILGRPYGEALEAGEIALRYDSAEGSFSAWYFDHRLPIRPSRYGDILRTVVAAAEGARTPAGKALLAVAARHADPGSPSRAEAPAFKAAIAAVEGGTEIIERGLAAYRAGPDNPPAVTLLHRLLERQHYRVAFWRVAITEINYRRFFDINDLAGIRVEDVATFRAVHRRLADLIAAGELHGLRLDHIDGLYDPARYCRRLQRLITAGRGTLAASRPFYVVAEKILADGEAMPEFPGVAGTTGYDALNDISRVLLDSSGLPRLDAALRDIVGESDFAAILRDAKKRVIETLLASEFTVLARLIARIAAGHWPSRDYTLDRLRAALELYVVHFPVYRTYIAGATVTAADRAIITRTIEVALQHWFGPDADILDFLKDALTLDLIAPGRVGYSRARVRRFSLKVQQFTGPVMAKAMEDTAFYRYHRLLALNEVGNDPAKPGLSIAAFHARMVVRAERTPHALTATATHDTKRGEDARARLLALSEIAGEWAEHVAEWARLNAAVIDRRNGRAPTAAHEYMLYQALLGAWPLAGLDAEFLARMQAYAVKATREGKEATSWSDPDESYESALAAFLDRLLDPARPEAFLAGFGAFARRIALLGALNGLAQLALKAMVPGVPDFYQGSELWDLALVDPDNRRPVDFARREAMLGDAGATPDWNALAENWADGRIKLAFAHRLLTVRRAHARLFAEARYEPVEVVGPDREHVIAFARILRREAVVVAVGRHFARFTEGGRQWMRPGDWRARLELDRFHGLSDLLHMGAAGESGPNGRGDVAGLFGAVPATVLHATLRR